MTQKLHDSSRHLGVALTDLHRRVDALERQQLRVITDPTQATGDPNNGYAVLVEGYLFDITSIDAYGIAIYDDSATEWVQILGSSDTGWTALTLINSWTGTLSYRVLNNELRINGVVQGGASGNAAALLPLGSRPTGDGGKVSVPAEHGGTIDAAYINVPGSGGAAGQIIPVFPTAASTISIAGVSFLIN